MVTGLPAVLVEAFSEAPLGGNGAAVVWLRHAATEGWMQRLAGSLKQSETAFLLPWDGAWALRWFTPRTEVPLCGHATLAALLALGHWGQLPDDGRATFRTRGGPLAVRQLVGGTPAGPPAATLGQLELPHCPLEALPPPAELDQLLRGQYQLTPEGYWHASLDYQVVLLPPTAPLARLEGVAQALRGDCRRGLVLMQAMPPGQEGAGRVADQRADYQLRFFSPELGIEEDPVTGSAHALVAPWWMERLNRPRVVGWQCSDRPGGMVCEAGSSGMIRLTGSGHLLWAGTLRVEPERCCAPSAPPSPPGPSANACAHWRQACGP